MELNEGAAKHARYTAQKASDAFKEVSKKITEKEERDALLAKTREFVKKGGDLARSGRKQVIDLSEKVFPNNDESKEENENGQVHADRQPRETDEESIEGNKQSEEDKSPKPTPSPRKSISAKYSSDINSPVKSTPSSTPMTSSKTNSPVEQPLSKEVKREESTDTFSIDNSPEKNQPNRPTISPKQTKKDIPIKRPLETTHNKPKIKKSQQNNPLPVKQIPSNFPNKSPEPKSPIEKSVDGQVPKLSSQTASSKLPRPPQMNPYPAQFPHGVYFVPPVFPYFDTNNTPPFFCYPPQPLPSGPREAETRHECKQAWIGDEDKLTQKYQLEKKLCRWLIRLMFNKNLRGTGGQHPVSCSQGTGMCSCCGNTTSSTPTGSKMILTELLRRQKSIPKCTPSQDIPQTPVCRNPKQQQSNLDLNMAASFLNQLKQTLSSHNPRNVTDSIPVQSNECIIQSKHIKECKREFFVDTSEVVTREKQMNDKNFETIQITIGKENNKPIKRPICVNLDLKQLCEEIECQNNEKKFENKHDKDIKKVISCTRQIVQKKETYCSQKTQTSLILISQPQENKNQVLKNIKVQTNQTENNTIKGKMCTCQFDEQQRRHIKDTLFTLKNINACVNSIKDKMVQETEKSKECCSQIKTDGVSKQTSMSNKIDSKQSSQVIADYTSENDNTHYVPVSKSQESMSFFNVLSSRVNSDINHQDSSESKFSTESSSSNEHYQLLKIPQFKGCSKNEYVLVKCAAYNGCCNATVTKKKDKKQDESLPVSQTGLHKHSGIENKGNTKYHVCEEKKFVVPICCTATAVNEKISKLKDKHSSATLHVNETVIQCTCGLKENSTKDKENPTSSKQNRKQKPRDENESKHMSDSSDKLELGEGSNRSCTKTNTFDSLRDLYSSASATPNISTIAHTRHKTSSSFQSTTSEAVNLLDCVNNLKYEKRNKKHDSKSSDNISREKVKLLPHNILKNETVDSSSDLGISKNSVTVSSNQVTGSEIKNSAWDQVIFERLKSIQKFISKAKRLEGIDLQLLKQKFETNIRQRHKSTRQLKILSDQAAEEKDEKQKSKLKEKNKNKDTYKIDGKSISAKLHGKKESDGSNIVDFLYSYLPFWSKETRDDGIIINIISKEDEGRKQRKPKLYEDSKENKSSKKKNIPDEKLNKRSDRSTSSEARNDRMEITESESSKGSEKQSHAQQKITMDEENSTTSEESVKTAQSQSDNTISTGELNSTKQVDGVNISSSGTNLISDTDSCTNDVQCCYEEVPCDVCPQKECTNDTQCCYEEVSCNACPQKDCTNDTQGCYEEVPCNVCPQKDYTNDTQCCYEEVPCNVCPQEDYKNDKGCCYKEVTCGVCHKEDNNSDTYYKGVNSTSPKQENYCNPLSQGGRTPCDPSKSENPNTKDRSCQGIRMYCKKRDPNKDVGNKNHEYEKVTTAEKTPSDHMQEKLNSCTEDKGMRNQKENMEESKNQESQRQPGNRNGKYCCPIKAPNSRNPNCYCTKIKQMTSFDTLKSSTAELNSSSWTPSFSSESRVETQARGDTKQVNSNDFKKQKDKCMEKIKDNVVKGTDSSEGKSKTKEQITDKPCSSPEKKSSKTPCVKEKRKYKEKQVEGSKKSSKQKKTNSSTSETNIFAYNYNDPPNKKIEKVTKSKHNSGKGKDTLPTANNLKGKEMFQLNNGDFGSSVDPQRFNQIQHLGNTFNKGDNSRSHKYKERKLSHKKSKDSLKTGKPDERCACEDVLICHKLNKQQHKKYHDNHNHIIPSHTEPFEQDNETEVLICQKYTKKHKNKDEDNKVSKTHAPVEESCTTAEELVHHKHNKHHHKKEEKCSKTSASTDKNIPTEVSVCHKTKHCEAESIGVGEHSQEASLCNECSPQKLVCKPVKVIRLSKCKHVICEDQRCFEEDIEDKPETKQETYIKQKKDSNAKLENKEDLENDAMTYITKIKCEMKIPRKIRVTFRQSKDPSTQSKEQNSAVNGFNTPPDLSNYGGQDLDNRKYSSSMLRESANNDSKATQIQDENIVNLSRMSSINGNHDNHIYRKSSKMETSRSNLPIIENIYDESQFRNNSDSQQQFTGVSKEDIASYQDNSEAENQTAVHLSRKSSPYVKDSKTSFRRSVMMKKISSNHLPVLFTSRKKSRSPSKSRKKAAKDSKVNMIKKGYPRPRSINNAVDVIPFENYCSYQNTEMPNALYPKPPTMAKATELLKNYEKKCTSLLQRRSRAYSKARIMSVHERLYQQRKK